MRRIALILGIAILSLVIMLATTQAAEKFGAVELGRIFNEYSKTKDYDKALSEKQGAYESEREKKVNEIKQLQEKMNLLSDKEKENKKSEVDSKMKALDDFDRQKQTDLRKEQDEKMKEILKDIEDVVKEYAEKESFTIVFNDRVLVYQAKGLDITDKIIAILNKNTKK
jgi:outer membrane protein